MKLATKPESLHLVNRSPADDWKTRVRWRDLCGMSLGESWFELLLPLPWLLLSCSLYQVGCLWAALPCSFYFFLTGLRVAHSLQHYHLAFSRRLQDCALFVLSLAMMSSLHAVQVAHLNHHRHCLDKHDFEGDAAHRGALAAIFGGPAFIARLHWKSWLIAAPPKRAWIAAELGACAALALAVLFFAPDALRWHVGVMLVGECLTGFFAVWSVHHHTDDSRALPGRTLRGRMLNRLFYDMFFHAEHHHFPHVPTGRLRELARRIDQETSSVAANSVFNTRNVHASPNP